MSDAAGVASSRSLPGEGRQGGTANPVGRGQRWGHVCHHQGDAAEDTSRIIRVLGGKGAAQGGGLVPRGVPHVPNRPIVDLMGTTETPSEPSELELDDVVITNPHIEAILENEDWVEDAS